MLNPKRKTNTNEPAQSQPLMLLSGLKSTSVRRYPQRQKRRQVPPVPNEAERRITPVSAYLRPKCVSGGAKLCRPCILPAEPIIHFFADVLWGKAVTRLNLFFEPLPRYRQRHGDRA